MNKKTTTLFIIMLYIPIFLGLSLYISKAILWGNNSTYLEAKSTLNSTSNLKNFKAGGTITLNSQDVNDLIGLYLPKIDTGNSLQIENVTCNINDSKINFYIPVNYHNIKLLISTQGNIEYKDTTFYYYPEYIKIGKLTVPKSLSYKLLKKYEWFNPEKERIEVKINKLPFHIESFELKKDIIEMKISKINSNNLNLFPTKDKLIKDIPNTKKEVPIIKEPDISPESDNQNSSKNKNSDLLNEMRKELEKVYSAADTSKEKEIIILIQESVDKMLKDENYSYKSDAANVKAKYSKLSDEEKNELKNTILFNMKINTLLNLRDMFLTQ